MERNELIRTVETMIAASSCCDELKAAGKQWLDSLGTAGENSAWTALIAEIREDISTLDHAISFYESELATQIFGAEKARGLAAHSRKRKAQGEKWCDCPACAAGVKILASIE